MLHDTIQIPAHHFYGRGKFPWLVIGRVPGDDDDTGFMILADDEEGARMTFVLELHEQAGTGPNDLEEIVAEHGKDHYITSLVMLT